MTAAPAASGISARPRVWLGAASPGALALPAARPTPAQLYAPRGVFCDGRVLIAADTGNHRVLIWHGMPTADGQPADVVLGQPDFYSEGPRAGGLGPERGMHLPTGICVAEGRLYIADAWHHRVLVWDRVPESSGRPPDSVLGQDGLASVVENRGGSPAGQRFYWPFGVRHIAGWLYVADTGNRRVLGWRGLPEPGQPPDLLLGQPSPEVREENRGGPAAADSFRWPHDLAGDGDALFVADAGNHRVLGWAPRPTCDGPAALVLGQADWAQARELPHVPQGPARMRFPYAVALDGGRLAVADTANNRVLIWCDAPRAGAGHPADAVLGQADFAGGGENRWLAVTHDSLCWPYGLHMCGGTLAIADSGNNRVVLWDIGGAQDG